MSVASAEWVRLLESEYLKDFIASGGSAVKIAVVLPQHTEEVTNAVAGSAQALGYQVVRVNAAQTRVHMIDQLFYAVTRQIEWDDLTERWLRDLLSRNGIAIAEGMPLQDTEALAAFNGLLVPDLFGQINRLITNALLKDLGVTQLESKSASARHRNYSQFGFNCVTPKIINFARSFALP